MTPGLITCLVALAAAAGIGAIWRSRNGTMRAPRPSTAARGDGGAATGQPGQRKPAAARRLTSADIGQPLGARATLLQFSSAFCAPCRATRRILADVADMTEGVTHIEIDAESRLDLVRDLGVLRTPTVFVLGPGGEIARRASGQPRRPDVIAALGTAILKPDDSYTSGRESG
ncbi:MAG: TlpA family protein disulfide reductase [Streptosporangiaceae bacterium]